jgi:hypothetical protein
MSDFFGSGMEPEGVFRGLDDPTPPAFGSELLPGVVQRGQAIRRQRRVAYGIGSVCAVLMLVGGAVGIANVGGGKSAPSPTLHGPTTPPATNHPHHHAHSPGLSVGGRHGGGTGRTQPTPQACVTPTPGGTDSPTVTPTPTETPPLSPVATASPAAYVESAPTDPACPSPGPTEAPTPTGSPSVTDTPSNPPLI